MEESSMLQDFKKFIMKGNVVDLAVGVVIGVAFGAVITGLVKDLITPLIAAIGGKPNFSNLSFTINHSQFLYGDFINALLGFVIVAAAIFFLVVKPINSLQDRASKRKTPEDPTEKKCPECLSDIPVAAKKCMYCTSKV
jgi:large conductance mechanosensitive channel